MGSVRGEDIGTVTGGNVSVYRTSDSDTRQKKVVPRKGKSVIDREVFPSEDVIRF